MSIHSLRLACLISGSGTTMEAILRATVQTNELQRVHVALVIASNADAGGISRAKEFGLQEEREIFVLNPNSDFKHRPEAFGQSIINLCGQHNINLIGQYGWMPQTPENLINAYSGNMINQHPGPLDPSRPGFGGKGMFGIRVHFARLYYLRTLYKPDERSEQVMWTEAVAQRVSVNYDDGPVLRRGRLHIDKHDTPTLLQARLLPIEYAVQIGTLRDFAEDLVQEQVLDQPLIEPINFPILEDAKRIAKMMYP